MDCAERGEVAMVVECVCQGSMALPNTHYTNLTRFQKGNLAVEGRGK